MPKFFILEESKFLKLVASTLDLVFTRGQFWPPGIVVAHVCVCLFVCQSPDCPRDILSPVQAGIAKFGREVQNALFNLHIVLGIDGP